MEARVLISEDIRRFDDLDELVLLLKGSEAGPGAKPIATEPAPQ